MQVTDLYRYLLRYIMSAEYTEWWSRIYSSISKPLRIKRTSTPLMIIDWSSSLCSFAAANASKLYREREFVSELKFNSIARRYYCNAAAEWWIHTSAISLYNYGYMHQSFFYIVAIRRELSQSLSEIIHGYYSHIFFAWLYSALLCIQLLIYIYRARAYQSCIVYTHYLLVTLSVIYLTLAGGPTTILKLYDDYRSLRC